MHDKISSEATPTGANPTDNPVANPGESSVNTPAPSSRANPPASKDAAVTEVRPKNPASNVTEVQPQLAPTPAAPTPPRDARTEAAPAKPHNVLRPDAPPKGEDPVTLGENYLYGKGVAQSCDRGLKLVKPAADQANTKAMITMGALYATGHCLTRDLPTAYRFFALALRRDPDNAALKQNVEMVWSQMTASERHQAIRLTQ
jgi:hypothetical protein